MKKLSVLLLAAALLIAMFAGCGNSAASEAEASAASAAAAASEEAAAEAPAEEEAAPAEEAEPAEEEAAPAEASAAEEAAPEEAAPEEEAVEYTLPLTTDDVTLTMFAITNSNVTDNIGSLQDHQIYQEAEKVTGVKVEINAVMQEVSADQFALVIASGDWPDMIRSASFSGGVTAAYDEDIIIDFADYLEYAPNYAAILDNNPNIAKDGKTDDGNILEMYFLNAYQGEFSVPLLEGPVIRQDLLDDAGLTAPETLEDLTNVLTTFKTNYDLDDPMYLGNDAFSASGWLMGAFDVTSDLYQVDGTVKYGPLEDGFKEYVELMTEWYNAGILNSDFYSYDDNPMSTVTEAKKTEGDIGVFSAPASNLAHYCSEAANYVGMKILGDENGENHFITTTVLDTGKGMNVTTTCSNIELAVQWCDFWYSEEGQLLSNYGIEGVTFEYDADGNPQWTDLLLNNSSGLSVGIARQCYVTLTQQPGVCPKDIEVGLLDDAVLETVDTWGLLGDDAYAMPNVSLTADESTRAAQIISDIDTLNEETWNKILLGQQSIDTWDDYIASVESMNIDEYISIYQDALDRYNAR